MRIVVTGATGNVGSALLEHLAGMSAVDAVVGVARRPPADGPVAARAEQWVTCDVGASGATTALTSAFRDADVVVHLAWRLQPSHQPAEMERVNLDGTRAVIDAVVAAGVPALVHASSIGAYSPGPKDRRVPESWPTGGVPSSVYSRHKATAERMLDRLEAEHPDRRVVRLRPGLILQAAAGAELARYFLGPLVPVTLLRPSLLPVLPIPPGLAVQAVHTTDAAHAFALAAVGDLHGAVNLAAEPVLDPATLGRLLHARPLPLPAGVLRGVVDLSWRLHLQPTDPGWIDLAMSAPLLDVTRARDELGWTAQTDAGTAVLEVLAGLRAGTGRPTAVMAPLRSYGGRLLDLMRSGRPGRGGS